MKTFITTALLFISTLLAAQSTIEIPKTEFKVSLPESSVSIKPGENKQVAMTITRSKSYSKLTAELSVFNSLPAGISISFEPIEGTLESSDVTVFASQDVAEGTYSIVLGATLNHKKKGSILNVTIHN